MAVSAVYGFPDERSRPTMWRERGRDRPARLRPARRPVDRK
ncbi:MULTISPECIES: hypothetical protein [Streptomyces]|nr:MULTISPECIES: hypothetical protein [Streptomyces]